METKTVFREKSLRDIWTATDKATIDIMEDTKSRNLNPSIKAPSPNKQTAVASESQTKKTSANFNGLEKRNVYGLFQPEIRKFEDDNVSLQSIWTPTNNDNLKNENVSFYKSPLIDLDETENSNAEQTNAYTFSTNASYKSSLIDLDPPVNTNIYDSSKDNNYENPLIDLGTSKNSCAKHIDNSTLPKEFTYRNISRYSSGSNSSNEYLSEKLDEAYPYMSKYVSGSKSNYDNISEKSSDETYRYRSQTRHDSGSKSNNDYITEKSAGETYRYMTKHDSGSKSNNDNISEKSSDELNEETFGKFSYAPNESELTLAAISDATAAYELEEDKSTQKTSKIRIFQFSESTKDVREVQETATGTKPKPHITKLYKQNNLQQSYPCDGKKRNREGKNTREMKDQNVSNLRKMNPNSDEIRESQENLPRCKSDPIQGKFRRNFTNHERRRGTTRTRETFHANVFPKVQAGIATHTRETFHKKGNESYYTTEKITYVRGEKLEHKYKNIHQDQENNIVWRNISDFGHAKDKKNSGTFKGSLRNNGTKFKKYFRENTVAQQNDEGQKLPTFEWKTNDEKYKLDEDNISRFNNQNISKRQESKKFNCFDQRKSLDNEISQDEKFNFRDKTAPNCIWQTPTDDSDSDERINIPHDKTSKFINKDSQKTVDVGYKNKKNVIHFKIYDPKLRSPTKKKITIIQYPADKLKSSSLNDPQTKKTGMHNAASGGNWTKDSQEQFNFKNVADKYPEQMKLQNNSQKEKTGISYASHKSLMTKDLRDNYEFLENINLDKADENKTFLKDILTDIKLTESNKARETSGMQEYSISEAKNDLESLTSNGEEIADLIVGCQRALDMFKSFYYEWIDLRKQSICLLEQIVMVIDKSSRKNDTMKHVIAAINVAAAAANFIPHQGVQFGAKVAGAVGGFFSNIFNRTDCKKDVNAKEYEIKEIFQKDIDSSSYVYLYGVQCGSQFQETCNAINNFYKLKRNYQSVIKDEDLLAFMNEIKEHKSSDALTFYKKLRTCYERLIRNSKSSDSRAFVRIFEDVPEAVGVIDLLPWKFDSDGFDNSTVQLAWNELLLLFQADNPTTVDIIKNKIQDCLLYLKKEHRILSRNVTDLFKEIVK